MVEKVLHFASRFEWDDALQNGFLKGRSNESFNESESQKYIHCLPSNSRDILEKYGRLDHLKRNAFYLYLAICLENPSPQKGDFLELEILLLNKERIFLRETAFFCERSKQYINNSRSGYGNYWDSTVSLEDYRGQFEVPEIWLPKKVHIDQIKIVKEYSGEGY